MYNDPIADLLTRIRNAQMRNKASVTVRCSKMIKRVLAVLRDEGFIGAFEERENDDGKPVIDVELKYYRSGKPAITSCRRVSKGGCRIYRQVKELSQVKSGLGITVVSTSEGVMSGREARRRGIGGEVLAAVS